MNPPRELPPDRIEAIRAELRRVLEALLLLAPPAAFTLERLLAAIDPSLREDAEAWLELADIELHEAADAARLLLDLVGEGGGAALSDEQEAALSALEFGAG